MKSCSTGGPPLGSELRRPDACCYLRQSYIYIYICTHLYLCLPRGSTYPIFFLNTIFQSPGTSCGRGGMTRTPSSLLAEGPHESLSLGGVVGFEVLFGRCRSRRTFVTPMTLCCTLVRVSLARTQYLRTLVPKTMNGMVFVCRNLKCWVLGPSVSYIITQSF